MSTNPLLIIAASEIDSNLYYATRFLAPDAFVYLDNRFRNSHFSPCTYSD